MMCVCGGRRDDLRGEGMREKTNFGGYYDKKGILIGLVGMS